jgi:hypothetical protein
MRLSLRYILHKGSARDQKNREEGESEVDRMWIQDGYAMSFV